MQKSIIIWVLLYSMNVTVYLTYLDASEISKSDLQGAERVFQEKVPPELQATIEKTMQEIAEQYPVKEEEMQKIRHLFSALNDNRNIIHLDEKDLHQFGVATKELLPKYWVIGDLAYEKFKEIGEPAVPFLAQQLVKEPAKQRQTALRVMSGIIYELNLQKKLQEEEYKNRYIPIFMRSLKDVNAEVRVMALGGLGDIGDDSVAPEIVKLLQDKDEAVSESAAMTLLRLKREDIIPPTKLKVLKSKHIGG